MFLALHFLFIVPILTLSDDEHPEWLCSYRNSEMVRDRDRRFLDSISIGDALKNVGKGLVNSDSIGSTMMFTGDLLKSLRPISGGLGGFLSGIKPMALAIGQVSDVVRMSSAKPPGAKPETQEDKFKHIGEKQRDNVDSITRGQLEKLKESSKKEDEKYAKTIRKQNEEVKNLSKLQFDQYKQMTEKDQRQQNVTLQLLKQTQNQNKADLENFKKTSEANEIEYKAALNVTAGLTDMSDQLQQEFLNLSKQQEATYDLMMNSSRELDTIAEQQKEQVQKLGNTMNELAQQQTQQVETVSKQIESIAKEQNTNFDTFSQDQTVKVEQLSKTLDDANKAQIEMFDSYAKEQEKVFNNISQELNDIKRYADQEKQQLNTLSKLVSEGFADIQSEMDTRFDKLEQLLKEVSEMTYYSDYESVIQYRVMSLHEAYLQFVKSVPNATEGDKNAVPLLNLVRKCCSNIPVELMGTLFAKTTQAKIQGKSLLEFIYESNFGIDSMKLVNLFQYIMDDNFKTMQMVEICDKVTKGYGLRVDEAETQFHNLAKTLDGYTSRLEAHSLEVLVDQSTYMDEVIKEWKGKKKPLALDLGCGIEELSGEFANFAARNLEKRFHFFNFFVTVVSYNQSSEKPNDWCQKRNTNFFQYVTRHSDEYRRKANSTSIVTRLKGGYENITMDFSVKYEQENIIILVSFIRADKEVDYNCLTNVKLHCPKTFSPNDLPGGITTAWNGIVCTIPNHVDVCGVSGAKFPYHTKECFHQDNSFLVSTCF